LMAALVSGVVEERMLGMSFAMYNLATGFATVLAPYTAGWMYTESVQAPFMLAAALAVVLGGTMLAAESGLTKHLVTPID